jgi:hypothetical protein
MLFRPGLCKLVQPAWQRSFKGLTYSGYLAVRLEREVVFAASLERKAVFQRFARSVKSFEAGVLRAFARSLGPLRSARVLAWGVQIFDNLVGC